MKYLQVIFICEGKSDYEYLKKILEYLNQDKKIKIAKVLLNGKTNYNKKNVIKEINKLVKLYISNGESKIIYVIDTDDINLSSYDKKLFEEIEEYTKANNYELIFFNRNIEEVINSSADLRDKHNEARRYNINKFISLDKKLLKARSPNIKNTSNILIVINNKKNGIKSRSFYYGKVEPEVLIKKHSMTC